MNRTFAYARLLLIGISATTISAAIIGQPLPVVGPAVAAAVLVAAHHVRTDDPDGDDRDGQTRAFATRTDGGRDGPDGSLDEWMNEQEGRR